MGQIMDIIPPKREPKSWRRLWRDFKTLSLGAIKKNKVPVLILGLSIIILLIALRVSFHPASQKSSNNTLSIVPANIKAAVNVPIYYPDPKKLPAGYTLDTNSFKKINDQAAGYVVTYDNGKRLVFTVQAKPSADEIDEFYKNQMPLHFSIDTGVGKAAVGVINNQTVASLPTNDKSWLLIAGPTDVNQDQLKQILKSIQKSD